MLWHDDILQQIEALNVQIQEAPDDGSLFFRRARLYHEHENFQEAHSDYLQAIQLGFQEPDVYYFLARLYKEEELPEEGIKYINLFIETQHAPVLGLIERARIYSLAGNYQLAIKDYNSAINLRRPFTGDYYIELADVILEQDAQAYVEAIAVIDQGLETLGWLPVLEDKAIALEISSGNVAGALRRLDATIAMVSRKEAYYVRKADLLLSVGRREEAKTCYQQAGRAIERLPGHHKNASYITELQNRINSVLAEFDN